MSVRPTNNLGSLSFLYIESLKQSNYADIDQKWSNPLESLDLIEAFCCQTLPKHSTLPIFSEAIQALKTLDLRRKSIKISQIQTMQQAVSNLLLVVAHLNDATGHGSAKLLEPLLLLMTPEKITIERQKVAQQCTKANLENYSRKYEAYATLLPFAEFFKNVMIDRGVKGIYYPLKSDVEFPTCSPWNRASSYVLNGKGGAGGKVRLFVMDHSGTTILAEERYVMYDEKDWYTNMTYSFQGSQYIIPMSSYPDKIDFPEGDGISISYEITESYLLRNQHQLDSEQVKKFYEQYGEKGVIGSITEVANFCLSGESQVFSGNERDQIWKFTSEVDISNRHMWFAIAAQRIATRRKQQLHRKSEKLATELNFYIPTSQLYAEWKKIANEINIPIPEDVKTAFNSLSNPERDLDDGQQISTTASYKKRKNTLPKERNPIAPTPSAATSTTSTFTERSTPTLPKERNPVAPTPSATRLKKARNPSLPLETFSTEYDRDLHSFSLRKMLNQTRHHKLRVKGSHIQVTVAGHGTRTMPRSSSGKKREAYEQIIVDWLSKISQESEK